MNPNLSLEMFGMMTSGIIGHGSFNDVRRPSLSRSGGALGSPGRLASLASSSLDAGWSWVQDWVQVAGISEVS